MFVSDGKIRWWMDSLVCPYFVGAGFYNEAKVGQGISVGEKQQEDLANELAKLLPFKPE